MDTHNEKQMSSSSSNICICGDKSEREVLVKSMQSEFRQLALVLSDSCIRNFYIAAYVGCEVCCKKNMNNIQLEFNYREFTSNVVWNVLRIAATRRHFNVIFAIFQVDPSNVLQCAISMNNKGDPSVISNKCCSRVLIGKVEDLLTCKHELTIKSEWLEKIVPFFEWNTELHFPPEYYAACNGCAYYFLKHGFLSAKSFVMSVRIALTLGHINFVTSICFVPPITLSEMSILRQQNADIGSVEEQKEAIAPVVDEKMTDIGSPEEKKETIAPIVIEKMTDDVRYSSDVMITNLGDLLLDRKIIRKSCDIFVNTVTGVGIWVNLPICFEMDRYWNSGSKKFGDIMALIVSNDWVDYISIARQTSGSVSDITAFDDKNSMMDHISQLIYANNGVTFKSQVVDKFDITVIIPPGYIKMNSSYASLTVLVANFVLIKIPLSNVSISLSYPKRIIKI